MVIVDTYDIPLIITNFLLTSAKVIASVTLLFSKAYLIFHTIIKIVEIGAWTRKRKLF